MGSCISKCKPNKKLKKDFSHVQDKLVISQDKPISSNPPKTTITPSDNLKPLFPTPSSSSCSSFSCSTNTTKLTTPSSSTISSSSSSCSTALLSSKDRSFSDEFLRSCVKDNPHISSLNPKTINQKDREKLANNVPTPKKRARANSPTLVRQKSFRKEQSYSYNPVLPNRTLRSPSPSRRFNNGASENNSFGRGIVSKGSNVVNSCPRRDSFRAPAASPNRDFTNGRNFSARKRDTLISQQVSGKIIDDVHVGVGDVKGKQDMDIVMEDINNPLIALDCFIFL
ncbi:hypothetical protein CASFOL_016168 [Castilleja foliolosa]|uniref:Uncharacterized protein n=1 Tax=Castilleja foliolosa TaxID=1961234 RepID=A0ABD3DK08_9LAMI